MRLRSAEVSALSPIHWFDDRRLIFVSFSGTIPVEENMISFEHCTYEAGNFEQEGVKLELWSAESEFHELNTAAGDLFAIIVEDPHGPCFLVHFSHHTIASSDTASSFDHDPAKKTTREANNKRKGLAASRFAGLLHLLMEADFADRLKGRKELRIMLAFLMRLRGLDGSWSGTTFDAIWTIIAAGHYENHVDRRVRRCGAVIARGMSDVDTLVLRLGLRMTSWNMLLTAYGAPTNRERLSPIEISPYVSHEDWEGGDLPPGWQRYRPYSDFSGNYIYRNTKTGYECKSLRAAILYYRHGDEWREYSDSKLPEGSKWHAKEVKGGTYYRKGDRAFKNLKLAYHYERYGDKYIACADKVAPGWKRRAEQERFRYKKGELECITIPMAKHLNDHGWYGWGKCDRKLNLSEQWTRRPKQKGSNVFVYKYDGTVFDTLKAARDHERRRTTKN